jgi:hypothetical protein
MLPQPIFSFENLKDLDTIVKLKRIQKQVTYFCTRPLLWTLRIHSNGERVEHPLVVWSFAPDNKREEQTSPTENKFSFGDVAHPHPVRQHKEFF